MFPISTHLGVTEVIMDTNEYLGQLFSIDRRIKDKLEEAVRWYEQATTIGCISGNPNKVQSSKKYDKMGDAVSYYVDLCDEANELAYKLANIKKTIVKQIDSMSNPITYAILKGHYLNGKTLADLALQENYSDSQIRRLYKKSMREFEQKYGETYLDKGENE